MDIDAAIKNPAGHFDSPEAVLADDRLSNAQKKSVLEQWKVDAKLLAEAAAENMSGGEPNMLSRVSAALAHLD